MAFQIDKSREYLSRAVALCALLFVVQACIAQSGTARIQGTVTDATGAAIGAAAITVTNLDTKGLFKTRSDGMGVFAVTALSAGRYKAEVRVAGFQSQTQKFSLTDSQVHTVQFKLAATKGR